LRSQGVLVASRADDRRLSPVKYGRHRLPTIRAIRY
jgi:hypothetical protein